MITTKGFTEIKELDKWELKPAGKYFLTRNGTSIIAFRIGGKFTPYSTGFKIIGTHTDSPNLRLNPVSKMEAQGTQQTCISTYGGGLWHTWFDRDLLLAGRVIYKKGDKLTSGLYNSVRPLVKIPTLAIHLLNSEESGAFKFSKEANLRPILSSEIYSQLNGDQEPKKENDFQKRHYWGLLQLIAKEMKISVDQLVDLDFSFADSNPAQLFGINEDFISSPRLDNLFSAYFSFRSIAESDGENSSFVDLTCAFDHEEIGSTSHQGANSIFLRKTVERIFESASTKDVAKDAFANAMMRSFVISADMAHSVHPNYPHKHQPLHAPKLNGGIVLKTNFNQRYMTDSVSGSILRELAKKAGVPIQEFVVRNDSRCGSTIGSMMASKLGAKTVDIGGGQLGMHSIRETCGVIDCYYQLRLFDEFFSGYEKIKHDLYEK